MAHSNTCSQSTWRNFFPCIHASIYVHLIWFFRYLKKKTIRSQPKACVVHIGSRGIVKYLFIWDLLSWAKSFLKPFSHCFFVSLSLSIKDLKKNNSMTICRPLLRRLPYSLLPSRVLHCFQTVSVGGMGVWHWIAPNYSIVANLFCLVFQMATSVTSCRLLSKTWIRQDPWLQVLHYSTTLCKTALFSNLPYLKQGSGPGEIFSVHNRLHRNCLQNRRTLWLGLNDMLWNRASRWSSWSRRWHTSNK